MSTAFYLSSFNPLAFGSHSKLQISGLKMYMQHNPALLQHPKFSYNLQSKIHEGISSKTCNKNVSHFCKDIIAIKAVKTDSHEVSSSAQGENAIDFDWTDEEDEGSPWEGAIVYRRNPSTSHVEYCSTLERLGLGKLSSEISKSRASAMGLRVTKAVKDYLQGTPVIVSVDITRKKHKFRLDGIIRTVISLPCNRCGEPAAENVFSNFSLLLSEQPIEEPEVINIGVIYREDKVRNSVGTEEDEEASIDLDDRFYFPPEEKEIDISKHIRDLVHLEITINSVCDPNCKGLCLICGTNLNTSSCNCSKQGVDDASYGPLGELRKKMQRK